MIENIRNVRRFIKAALFYEWCSVTESGSAMYTFFIYYTFSKDDMWLGWSLGVVALLN